VKKHKEALLIQWGVIRYQRGAKCRLLGQRAAGPALVRNPVPEN